MVKPMRLSSLFRPLLKLVPFLLAGCLKTESDYKVRGSQVFYVSYRGNGLWNEGREVLVEGADGKTFKPISPGLYARDAVHIIYAASVLKGSDAKTFKLLDPEGNYAKDARQVYCRNVLEGADPATFEFVGNVNEYRDARNFYRVGRDSKDYYLGYYPLHVRDMASFKIVIEGGAFGDLWAYDKHSYYVGEQAFAIADIATFQVLKSGYAKDAKHVYHLKEVLPDADPAAFVAFDGDYAKDAAHVFHVSDRILDPKVTVQEGVDAGTFEYLKAHYARDSKRVYFDGYVVADADPATFVAMDYCYGKDAKHAFNGSSIVEGVDLPTFQSVGPDNASGGRLESGYAKDAHRVYCGGSIVFDADVASFQAVKGRAWDKSKTYYGTQGK